MTTAFGGRYSIQLSYGRNSERWNDTGSGGLKASALSVRLSRVGFHHRQSMLTGEGWCLKSVHLYGAYDLKWCMDGVAGRVAGNHYLSVKQTL